MDEINELVRQFDACTLPREKWTHHAHIKVAFFYLHNLPVEEATERIRNGIQRYNESCGIVTTRTTGYHETITLFYIWAIDNFIAESDAHSSLDSLVDDFIRQHGQVNYLLEFYSRVCLFSIAARSGWIEPDLKLRQ